MNSTNSALLYLQNRIKKDDHYITHWINANDDELEDTHNFIQNCFPLNEVSRFNRDSFVLHTDNIPLYLLTQSKEFDPKFYLRMYRRMLKFYGIKQWNTFGTTITFKWFNFNKNNWLTPLNHNHLRLSRIVKSLEIFGFDDKSKSLLEFLLHVAKENPEGFSTPTIRLWETIQANLFYV